MNIESQDGIMHEIGFGEANGSSMESFDVCAEIKIGSLNLLHITF